MTHHLSIQTVSSLSDHFNSLASLRNAHGDLLKVYRSSPLTPELIDTIKAFLNKGKATGVLLDTESDRTMAQSLLDYWTSLLYRVGYEVPDTTLDEFDPNLAPELDDSQCPYLGLDAFNENQHNLFYGRQRLLEQLLNHLRNQHFLAVLGSSGSGKSSIVLGGVLPSLKAGKLPNSEHWHYYPTIVPGTYPLENLARAIFFKMEQDTGTIQEDVEHFFRNSGHLLKILNQVRNPPAVLVVDQFEETFTLCSSPFQRQAFINNLLRVIQSPESQHIIILTMRTDFEDKVAQYSELQKEFDKGQIRVRAMDGGELRDAIEKPAELVGLKFEEGLVEELVGDVLGEPAALPLLQFTLLKLWENRVRNRVTFETYKRLGGGRSALGKSADEFYNKLIPEDQITAKRILLKMVRPTEGLEVTSNRIRCESLYQMGEASDRVNRVLDKLIQARLVRLTGRKMPVGTRDFAALRGASLQIEIAHEALVRNWSQLVEWLEDERVNMRQRLRLTSIAQAWLEREKDPSVLLRGAVLQDAKKAPDLSSLEIDFLQCSEQAEKQEQEQELKAKRKLEQARFIAVFMAIFALGMGTITLWRNGVLERLRSHQQTADILLLSGSPNLEALTTALRAQRKLEQHPILRIWPPNVELNKQLKGILNNALYQTQERNRIKSSSWIEYSKNRDTILTISEDKKVRLWDGKGQFIKELTEHQGEVTAAVLSEDGKFIVTLSKDNKVQIWNHEGKTLGELPELEKQVTNMGFISDANFIWIYLEDNTVRLWNVEGKPFEFQGLKDQIENIETNDKGQFMLTYSQDKTLQSWNAKEQQLGFKKQHVKGYYLSKDGQFIVTVSEDNKVQIWNNQGKKISELSKLQEQVSSVGLSLDANFIVTNLEGDTALLWNLQGQPFKFKGLQEKINSIKFSENSQLILTLLEDKTVQLWNRQGQKLAEIKKDDNNIERAFFSKYGNFIFTFSSDNTVQVWNHQGKFIANFKGHQDDVDSAEFSPDQKFVLTTSVDNTVRVFAFKSPFLTELHGIQKQVNWVYYSPDKNFIRTYLEDGTHLFWSREGQPFELKGFQGQLKWVTFSENGQLILTRSKDKIVQLWDSQGQPLTFKQEKVEWADLSKDGQFIVTLSKNNKVKVWNREGEVLSELKGLQEKVNWVWLSPDGSMIRTAIENNKSRLWSRQGQPIELKGVQNQPYTFEFSPDSNIIIGYFRDGTHRLWNRQGELFKLKGLESDITNVEFSKDNQLIVTASENNLAQIWNRQGELIKTLPSDSSKFKLAWFSPDRAQIWNRQGELVKTLPSASSKFKLAKFSPDSQFIITASEDKNAQVWNRNGQLVTELKGHQAQIQEAAFSEDSKLILTRAENNTLRVWNMDGQMLAELRGIKRAEFSKDSQSILTLADNNTVRLWRVPTLHPNLSGQVCEQIGDYLKYGSDVEEQDRKLCDGVGNSEP